MGKPQKTLTDRVNAMESQLTQITSALDSIGAAVNTLTVAAATSSIPTLAKETTPPDDVLANTSVTVDNQAEGPLFVETEPEQNTEPEMPAPRVGRIGREYTPEEEVTSLDQFLFYEGPDMIRKISEGDTASAIVMTDLLLHENYRTSYFFVLWFAATEDVRKFLLFVIVTRNLPISVARFELLKTSISPAAFKEVQETYQQMVRNTEVAQSA